MAEGTRVVVGVSGSLNSFAALHRGIEEARLRDALLVPVLAWSPPCGEMAYRRSPCPSLLEEWERAACERLSGTLEQAFAGHSLGVHARPIVVRGEPGPALVATADHPGDLLVVGAGRRGRLQRLIHGSVSRYCLSHARCSVVGVPPSELFGTLDRMLRNGGPKSTKELVVRTHVPR